jgi:hypothetical protein
MKELDHLEDLGIWKGYYQMTPRKGVGLVALELSSLEKKY